VNPRVALFNQVGTRAVRTAFTRWRVGFVLSMIDSAFRPFLVYEEVDDVTIEPITAYIV
jgi:hypothetical protein